MFILKDTDRPAFATHPWKHLRDELEARWWTQKDFSKIIWKKESEVSQIISWKKNITVLWANLVATALETSPDTWLNLQKEYDLFIFNQSSKKSVFSDILKRAKEFETNKTV